MVREHVAQLRPRRRDKNGMDHAKGRAMIHKFTLGHNTRERDNVRKSPRQINF
jgi:hypothetical protein